MSETVSHQERKGTGRALVYALTQSFIRAWTDGGKLKLLEFRRGIGENCLIQKIE